MAQLSTVLSSIKNSGIDRSRAEVGLYGPVTVRQSLDGKHVKRAIQTHLITLQTLFMLYVGSHTDKGGITVYLARQLLNHPLTLEND